jgi:hypothetical protein
LTNHFFSHLISEHARKNFAQMVVPLGVGGIAPAQKIWAANKKDFAETPKQSDREYE